MTSEICSADISSSRESVLEFVQWQQESSPGGSCRGLSWLSLPLKGVVQPKMNPLMSLQTWMLIIFSGTTTDSEMDKKNPRDLFQVLWSHMILLCEKKSRMYCIPVTAAFKCPSPFHIFKKAVSHWQQTWCNKSVSKREEDHKYISTWISVYFMVICFPPL